MVKNHKNHPQIFYHIVKFLQKHIHVIIMDYEKDVIALFSKQLCNQMGSSNDSLYGPGHKSCNNKVAMAMLNIPQSTSPCCFCTCGTMVTFMFSSNTEPTKAIIELLISS